MEKENDVRGSTSIISPLALSALGFAAFLTILNLSGSDRSTVLIWATYCFAAGLPLYVAAAVTATLPNQEHRRFVDALFAFCNWFGTILIMAGLTLCFWDIDPVAGKLFFGVILGYLVIMVILSINRTA